MKNNFCQRLGLGLLLSLLGSIAFAKPELNGLASYHDLGKERFIAALYAENLSSNPVELLSGSEARRMVVKITTKTYSPRRFNRVWIEGMAVNSSGATLTEHAQNMVKFTNMIKRRLSQGDILTIDGIPGKGTQVAINGVDLGSIDNENFFSLLLRTWIGAVPLSSDFRSALLQRGKVDKELLSRFEAIKPSAERIADIKEWNSSDTAETTTVSIAKPNILPSIEPAAPTAIKPAMTKPQVATSTAAKNNSSNTKKTPKPQTAKPKPPAAEKKVAVIQSPPIKQAPAERDEFDDDNDADEGPEVITAEGLLNRQLYHSKLLKWTYQYLQYPPRAQKRNQKGSVRLSVVIDRTGNVQDIRVVENSPYELLNKEARRAVKRANPYPPMPEDMTGEQFAFSLPIVFRIK